MELQVKFVQCEEAHGRLGSNRLSTHKGEPALENKSELLHFIRQFVVIGQPTSLQFSTESFQQALGFNQG